VRKRMTTFHRTPQGYVAYTKGAPESVIPVCTTHWREADAGGAHHLDVAVWRARADALAAQGLRVLAVALRTYAHLPEAGGEIEAVESGLCFIGLVGLMDPPCAACASTLA
jgi:Ca2+-transporting ATPase